MEAAKIYGVKTRQGVDCFLLPSTVICDIYVNECV